MNSEKVEVPYEVYRAFENLKRSWRNLLPEKEAALLFLNVGFVAQTGDMLILKEYSQKEPINYIRALANGCVPSRKEQLIKEQLTEMIQHWLDKPYVGDEKRDVEHFASQITQFFKQYA